MPPAWLNSHVGPHTEMEKTIRKSEPRFKYFLWHSGRFAGAFFVTISLPLAHVLWGERYSGDGPSEFGELMMFGMLGICASLIYLVVGTIAHFVARRKSLRALAVTEASVLCLFLGVLVLAGILAHHL